MAIGFRHHTVGLQLYYVQTRYSCLSIGEDADDMASRRFRWCALIGFSGSPGFHHVGLSHLYSTS